MTVRVLMTLALIASLAGAQEAAEKSCCGRGKPKPWEPYNRNIVWQPDLDTAYRKAAETDKPVLFFDLVGDLDKEGC